MRIKFLFIFILAVSACAPSGRSWQQLKEADCVQYTFGRIDAKRMLTEEDKSKLLKQGLRIQEFVLENQYLGCWDRKWNQKVLDKTPIASLNPFEIKDKLGSGMQLSKLNELSQSPGKSMVLIQTLSSVDSLELKQYGSIIFKRDHFYRLLVDHANLPELLEYPCLRLMSIVKDQYEPDQK